MVGSERLLIATRMGGGTDREREEGGELVVTSYCFRCTVYGTKYLPFELGGRDPLLRNDIKYGAVVS